MNEQNRIISFLKENSSFTTKELVTAPEDIVVTIPTMECILGDKLTAFAPHTTGVLLGKKFTPEIAAEKACSVMCLAAIALTQTDYPKIADAAGYAKERLAGDQYKRLAYIRKRYLKAYGYLVEATRMLEGV